MLYSYHVPCFNFICGGYIDQTSRNHFTIHDILRILSNCILTLDLFFLMPFAISSSAAMNPLDSRESFSYAKIAHTNTTIMCISMFHSVLSFCLYILFTKYTMGSVFIYLYVPGTRDPMVFITKTLTSLSYLLPRYCERKRMIVVRNRINS
jgi:hypothetical protein